MAGEEASGEASPSAAGGSGGATSMPPATSAFAPARTRLRRLSKSEVRNTIIDLVGLDPNDSSDFRSGWPEELPPFDTFADKQSMDLPFIQASITLADDIARRVALNDGRRQTVVGCTAADAMCMRKFIATFGRRALRRPLEEDEIADLLKTAGTNGADFPTQVETVLRTILRDPELLYLIECGGCTRGANAGPVPSDDQAFALGSFEVASRLSYLIWGSKPDDQLLEAAERNALGSPEAIRQQALRMLSQTQATDRVKRVRERVNRFHAMWLGYGWSGALLRLPAEMNAETNALLERVIFERRAPWLDIFRSKQTYVDATLAAHYGGGLPRPAKGSAWVNYPANGRQGILSHATFLSVDNQPMDTSPTFRGKGIRTRILCEEIQRPTAAQLAALNGGKPVDTSPPKPRPGECKSARYERSYLHGGCAACHNQIDPIGFGLENYDKEGKYRSKELLEPACAISGDGKLLLPGGELQAFTGVAGLSDLLVGTEEMRSKVGRCLSSNFFQFAAGRREDAALDGPFIDALAKQFAERDFDFQELVVSLVASPTWSLRLADAPKN